MIAVAFLGLILLVSILAGLAVRNASGLTIMANYALDLDDTLRRHGYEHEADLIAAAHDLDGILP